MINKIATIGLIFSVNLLLLTHAVLPHHHHGNAPCFSITDIHTSDECNKFSNQKDIDACCSHENESSKEDRCILEHLFIISINNDSRNEYINIAIDQFNNHELFLFFNPSFKQDIFAEISRRYVNLPYLINYSSILAYQYLGMRAPPVL